jgi:hypothetical protein
MKVFIDIVLSKGFSKIADPVPNKIDFGGHVLKVDIIGDVTVKRLYTLRFPRITVFTEVIVAVETVRKIEIFTFRYQFDVVGPAVFFCTTQPLHNDVTLDKKKLNSRRNRQKRLTSGQLSITLPILSSWVGLALTTLPGRNTYLTCFFKS